jgi:hypothetical protein
VVQGLTMPRFLRAAYGEKQKPQVAPTSRPE